VNHYNLIVPVLLFSFLLYGIAYIVENIKNIYEIIVYNTEKNNIYDYVYFIVYMIILIIFLWTEYNLIVFVIYQLI